MNRKLLISHIITFLITGSVMGFFIYKAMTVTTSARYLYTVLAALSVSLLLLSTLISRLLGYKKHVAVIEDSS